MNSNFVPKLFDLISELSATVFTRLTSLEDFTQHPDVVEELFYCMGRVIKSCPSLLVTVNSNGAGELMLLSSLVQGALLAMEVDHRDANRGTMNFLEHLVLFGVESRQSHSAVFRLIQQHGPELVRKSIRALMGELPLYCLDRRGGSISGLLFNLNRLSPNVFQQWMLAALELAPERLRDDLMNATQRVDRQQQSDFDLAVRSFKVASERCRKLNR